LVFPVRAKIAATKIKIKPGDHLLPYQRAWVDDHSRWKFGLMARQVGKDFSSGFEGVADCALAERTGQKIDWLIASSSERPSLESLQKRKAWAETFKPMLAGEEELREASGEGLLKAATITFSHGSRVLAVPGNRVSACRANAGLTETLSLYGVNTL
jgi:phage FluMu gp28-like protein